MILRGICLLAAVAFGLLSVGGVSYGLSPASGGEGGVMLAVLIFCIAATVMFIWLAFRPGKKS